MSSICLTPLTDLLMSDICFIDTVKILFVLITVGENIIATTKIRNH